VVVEVNAEPDILLRNLVSLVNNVKDGSVLIDEIGLTLHVSGLIVSGDLISYENYLAGLAALLRGNGSPDSQAVREAFASTFELLAYDNEVTGTGAESDRPDETPAPSYIHLRAATIDSPAHPGYFPRTLWRGRLAHVSAWSMGRIDSSLGPR
jgi:hypothetical protein